MITIIRNNIHCILSFCVLIIAIIIWRYSKNEEYFKTVQYMYQYPGAVEDHNFGPTIENCVNECKQLNSNLEDQARCITYCGYNSRYIPYEEMIPNTEILYNYL